MKSVFSRDYVYVILIKQSQLPSHTAQHNGEIQDHPIKPCLLEV